MNMTMKRAGTGEHVLADAVLLIDGDNDPNVPPDYPLTQNTLVRVFLRPQAAMPRSLEKKVGHLPLCVPVLSIRGGANAADFAMSLHAGILHATLPLHLPFTFVTNDKSLAVMVQELQRLGRQAALWSSHPDRSVAPSRRSRSSSAAPASRSGRGSRTRRGRGGRSAAPKVQEQPKPEPVSETMAVPEAPRPDNGAPDQALAKAAAAYARRLASIKDPPARLKTLLNDIANRTANTGHPPQAILDELQRMGALTVDKDGHVQVFRPSR
jgi:hypothetical protein